MHRLLFLCMPVTVTCDEVPYDYSCSTLLPPSFLFKQAWWPYTLQALCKSFSCFNHLTLPRESVWWTYFPAAKPLKLRWSIHLISAAPHYYKMITHHCLPKSLVAFSMENGHSTIILCLLLYIPNYRLREYSRRPMSRQKLCRTPYSTLLFL